MIITHKIKMDLSRRGITPVVYMMQGDSNTRALEILLYDNGQPWEIPQGITAAVAFSKADGTKGLYDKLPDKSDATTLARSVVTAILAPEVLTCAGQVRVAIVLYDAEMDTLATFTIMVVVEANPAAGEQISNNYYYLQNMEQVNLAYQELLTRLDALDNSINTEAINVPIDTSAVADGAPVSFNIGDTLTFGTQSYWSHIRLAVKPKETYKVRHKVNTTTTHYFVLLCDTNDKILYRYAAGGADALIDTEVTIPDDSTIAYMQAISYYGADQPYYLQVWKIDNAATLDSIIEKDALLYYNVTPPLEMGNIGISDTGWTYGYHNERVRTPEGYAIPLRVGDVISLTDYSNAKYYLGWKRADGTYATDWIWHTSDFTVTEPGDYVILLTNITTATNYGSGALGGLLRVKCNSPTALVHEDVDELHKDVNALQDDVAALKADVSEIIASGGGENEETETRYIPLDTSAVADGAPASFNIGDTLAFGTQGYWCHVKLAVVPGEDYKIKHAVNGNASHYFVLLCDKNNKILYRYAAGGANADIVTELTIPSDGNIAYMQAVSYAGKGNTHKLQIWKAESVNPYSFIEKDALLYYYVNPELELGNITIGNTGWEYGFHQGRVRTPEGYTIPLKVGDVISLTDYTDARYYLGWRKTDGTYGQRGWLTKDYTVIEDGEYVILLSNITEKTQYGCGALGGLLRVRRNNSASASASVKTNMTDLFIRKKCRTIAHGGSPASGAAEQTKTAYIAAAKAGYWGLEADIMQTKDGKYVCCHDVYVDDVTTSTGLVSSYTLAQLKAMTMRVRGSQTTVADKFLTLEEFLDICMIYGCVPVVELKVPSTYNGASVDPQYDYEYIVNAIKERGLERTSIAISFYWDRLEGLRLYSDNIHVMIIVNGNPDSQEQCKNIYADGNGGFDIGEAQACLTRENVDAWKAQGCTVFTWTSYAHDRSYAIKNRDIGVDGITAEGIADVLQL